MTNIIYSEAARSGMVSGFATLSLSDNKIGFEKSYITISGLIIWQKAQKCLLSGNPSRGKVSLKLLSMGYRIQLGITTRRGQVTNYDLGNPDLFVSGFFAPLGVPVRAFGITNAPACLTNAPVSVTNALTSLPVRAMGSPIRATGTENGLLAATNALISLPIIATGVPVRANGVPIRANGVPIRATGVPIRLSGVPIRVTGTANALLAATNTPSLAANALSSGRFQVLNDNIN